MMVFSDADKAIIKHYHERGYTAYKLWKDNPEKHWDKTSVKRLEGFGTIERQIGSACPRTATTPEKRRIRRENDLFSIRSSRD